MCSVYQKCFTEKLIQVYGQAVACGTAEFIEFNVARLINYKLILKNVCISIRLK